MFECLLRTIIVDKGPPPPVGRYVYLPDLYPFRGIYNNLLLRDAEVCHCGLKRHRGVELAIVPYYHSLPSERSICVREHIYKPEPHRFFYQLRDRH